jgi:uncharacterized integral membrane protein
MSEEEQGWTELEERQGAGRAGELRGTGVSRWSLLLLVVAITLAVILGQNTERVEVDVLWTSFRAPLFLVVILVGLGITALWEVGTLALRHRRRRARRR